MSFAQGPDADKEISVLTTSSKSDTPATRVIGIQVRLVIAGVRGLPPQKLRVGRARPKPVIKALRGKDGSSIFTSTDFEYSITCSSAKGVARAKMKR
jgi:hypothetical protein